MSQEEKRALETQLAEDQTAGTVLDNKDDNTTGVEGQRSDAKHEVDGSVKSAEGTDGSEGSDVCDEKVEKKSMVLTGFKLYACIFSLVLATLIVALDVFIVATIIDVVSKKLGGYAKTGWLITGYSLPNSLLSLLWGRAAALWGFQTSMLLSILIFEVGSIVSATANSMDTLIAGRVVAGIGGSGLQTLSLIIASSVVEEKNRSMTVSIVMSAFAVASLIGPFIGGAFTTHTTWRWCFWISLPVGGAAAVIFFFTYNPDKLSFLARFGRLSDSIRSIEFKKFGQKKTYKSFLRELMFRFDILGFFLTCSGVCLFLLGLTFGGENNSWKRALVICFLIIGFLLFVSGILYDFYIYDRINPDPNNPLYRPILKKGLVNHKYVLLANLVTISSSISFAAYMVYSVQFYQLILGYTAWDAGIHLIPLVVSSLVSAIFCGVLTKKTGHVKMVLIGNMILLLVGGGVATMLDNKSGNSMQIGVWILPGFGLGAALQCALISSQLQIVKEDNPDAETELIEVTAFNSFTKSLGSSIGSVLATTIFVSTLWRRVNDMELEGYYGRKINELVRYRLEHFDGRYTIAAKTFSKSTTDVFWMAFGFSVFSFICSLLSSHKKVFIEKKESKEEGNDLPSIPDSSSNA